MQGGIIARQACVVFSYVCHETYKPQQPCLASATALGTTAEVPWSKLLDVSLQGALSRVK